MKDNDIRYSDLNRVLLDIWAQVNKRGWASFELDDGPEAAEALRAIREEDDTLAPVGCLYIAENGDKDHGPFVLITE